MEDFLKFLLIAGVILVGIFKEVNKNSKSKKAKNKRPVSPMPSPVEVAPDAVPMPEAWGGPKSLEELFQPKPLKQTPPQQSPKQTAKPAAQQKRKKEERAHRKRKRSIPECLAGLGFPGWLSRTRRILSLSGICFLWCRIILCIFNANRRSKRYTDGVI